MHAFARYLPLVPLLLLPAAVCCSPLPHQLPAVSFRPGECTYSINAHLQQQTQLQLQPQLAAGNVLAFVVDVIGGLS